MRFLRRLFLIVFLISLLIFAAGYAYVRAKRPALQERTEIYRGIYYQCVDLPSHIPGEGRVMIVEAQLLVPGVEVVLRPYDERALSKQKHYVLSLADYEVRRQELDVFCNGVRYEQADKWQSLPGISKRVHETVVVDEEVSHIHEHSYLLWCDANRVLKLEKQKPPPKHAVDSATWALGTQGVAVSNGRVSPHLLSDAAPKHLEPRTFIGIDSDRSVLWLIAFESTTETGTAQFAAELGIVDGGTLDSGDGTSLLIGKGAAGIAPYTGIRGARPLASWIGIRAEEANR